MKRTSRNHSRAMQLWTRWLTTGLAAASLIGCWMPPSPVTGPPPGNSVNVAARGASVHGRTQASFSPSLTPSTTTSQAAWQATSNENSTSIAPIQAGSLDATKMLPGHARVPNETEAYLVRVTNTSTLTTVLRNPALRESRVTARIPWGEGWLLRLEAPEGGDTPSWRQSVSSLPEIRGMVREGRKYKLADPELPKQWAHASTTANTTRAWDLVPPDHQASIVVAVLDTGLDIAHPEFAGRIVTPFNAMDGASPTTNVEDDDGHGTHVTGIIAANGQNGVGGAGVAWGVRILPVKVLTAEGGWDSEILNGFMHAVNWRPSPDDGSRVRVINMSLGNSSAGVSALYSEAAAIARAAGIVVVAASGNDAAGFVSSPANSPGMVAVGSSFRHAAWEGVSAFSNGGPRLDLVAPGEEIYAPLPDGNYGFLSGTSMASPYVAGVAALLMARYDPLNARTDATFVDLVRQRLTRAVKDVGLPGRDDLAGSGRLDAGRALAPATLEALP